jgi:acetyl esterase/lipase
MSFQSIRFAQLTWGESLGFWFNVLQIPVVLIQGLVCLPFVSRCGKTRKRHILDLIVRRLVDNLNGPQLQMLLGTDERTYKIWAWLTGVKPLIEPVPESQASGRRILWMGKRPEAGSHDRVVIYLHGGGYALPLQGFAMPLFMYLQKQVTRHLASSSTEAQKPSCSVAIVEYTLATEAPWPAPLREASAAIQHIINTGISPANIIIVGDSAGANLSYQILQHILNPRVPTVSPLDLGRDSAGAARKLAGVFFISPWFDLQGLHASFRGAIQAKADVITDNFILMCGSTTLNGLNPSNEDEGKKWLLGRLSPVGLENIVERVLVYGGGQERLIDGILEFAESLKPVFDSQTSEGKDRFELVVDEIGVHDDPIFEMFARMGTNPDKTTKGVVKWLCDTFEKSTSG